MRNLLLFLVTVFILNLSSNAQVGIGQVPKNSSILDLTNSNNKYLILPVPSTDPASIMTDSAAVLYYKGNIYLKTSAGIKVFTPWKWDGDSTHSISSPSSAPVGIGIIPSVSNYRLQVDDAGEVTVASNSPAALVVGEVNGNPVCPHILIDQNEIMAKSNASNAGTLNLQEEGGIVEIRGANDAGTSTVLTAKGSIDAAGKLKENGNDLLPVGAIIMWSGSTPPAGWALCDGNSYTGMDGVSTIVTPNLKERFIVGFGDNPAVPGGPYAYGATGGKDSVLLSINQIPAHNHTGNTGLGGNHNHGGSTGSAGWEASSFGVSDVWGETNVANNVNSHSHSISNSGTHPHTISSQGGGLSHENRPPYYALAFIMKL